MHWVYVVWIWIICTYSEMGAPGRLHWILNIEYWLFNIGKWMFWYCILIIWYLILNIWYRISCIKYWIFDIEYFNAHHWLNNWIVNISISNIEYVLNIEYCAQKVRWVHAGPAQERQFFLTESTGSRRSALCSLFLPFIHSFVFRHN